MKILLSGSLGSIFSNFIRNTIDKYPKIQFICVDKAIEKYSLNNLFEHPRHKFYLGDCGDQLFMDNLFDIERPNYVLQAHASSNVDDSIKYACDFTYNNITSTQVMIDKAIKYNVEKYMLISTDEVMGHFKESEKSHKWNENDPINPRNPYSASKASAELMVKAAGETHGLPWVISRSCNCYGPRQPPRNLVPRIICNLLKDIAIPIHGNGKNIREWQYVDDNCEGIMTALLSGKCGEIYNVGSGFEMENIEMVHYIANQLGVTNPKIKFIEDRKGHDFRYSINFDKIKSLGWSPKYSFEDGMKLTIDWYKDNFEKYNQWI